MPKNIYPNKLLPFSLITTIYHRQTLSNKTKQNSTTTTTKS